jgi:hypothetical protein
MIFIYIIEVVFVGFWDENQVQPYCIEMIF